MERGAEQTDHRLLHDRAAVGQEDVRRHAQEARGIGDALAVVAGRGRHRRFDRRLRLRDQQVIEGAAQLERGDRRRGLELEPDIGVERSRQGLRAVERRRRHVWLQPLGRLLDALEGGSRARHARLVRSGPMSDGVTPAVAMSAGNSPRAIRLAVVRPSEEDIMMP
jgi:hypothetical protein